MASDVVHFAKNVTGKKQLLVTQLSMSAVSQVTTDVMARDPQRLVTGASGWDDFPVGHIADGHVYPGPSNNGVKVT